ncbi:MAG: OmpA family protein [Coprobacter sp.]|nr:OmpA family protein [Coprobacter sp.]
MKYLRLILLVVPVVLLSYGCGAKLSTANAQFERGEYFAAAATYRKIYNKTSSKEREKRGMVAYRIGECYRRLNAAPRSSAGYQNAVRYDYPDSMAVYYLARGLHMQGKYREAAKQYEAFLSIKPGDKMAENGLKGCEAAVKWKENPTRYVVKAAKLFNSRRSECAPMFLGTDNDILYFTSANDKATGDKKSDITGVKSNDIFFSKKDEKGAWQRPELAEGGVNTAADEGIISFSPDGNTMYLSRARHEEGINTSVEICTSTRSDAQWGAATLFAITGDTLSTFAHPAVSPDGRYLYFTSDVPGGYGGKDLWRIDLEDKGSGIENLGVQINTPGDEMFPYIRDNGDLYFASDGHPGMGGLDIFKATQNSLGVWKIENLGMPVNSAGDDFGITFETGREAGFLSSNRKDARGYDHIFSFELPLIEVWITGSVLDQDEIPIPNAVIRIVGKDGSNQKAYSKEDGTYKFKLGLGVDYVMMAGCKGFLNSRGEFTSDSEERNETYGLDFILAAINKPVIVENVFYEFDKADVTKESAAALNEIIQMLEDNPNVSIELSAHTDMKGSEAYNLGLSERRAKAVVEYLIQHGVAADRLTPKGYGKSSPRTITRKQAKEYPMFKEGDVLTDEYILALPPEHQELANALNRRTEFRVLDVNYRLM